MSLLMFMFVCSGDWLIWRHRTWRHRCWWWSSAQRLWLAALVMMVCLWLLFVVTYLLSTACL